MIMCISNFLSFIVLIFISALFTFTPCFGQINSPVDYVSRVEAHALSDAVYYDKYGVGNLLPGWSFQKGHEDKLSGLKWAVYTRDSDGQRVLAFAGTRNWTDWRNNIISSSSIFDALPPELGSIHLQYDRAEQVALDQLHENKYSGSGKPLILVGDSKAGGHVQYVGAITKTPGIAVHPAPLGNALFERIPTSNRKWANQGGILRLELTSDPVSKLDILPGSRHLGIEESYQMPSIFRDAYKRSTFNISPEVFPEYLVTSHTQRDLLRRALIDAEAERDLENQKNSINYFKIVVVDKDAADLCLGTASALEDVANFLDKDLGSSFIGDIKTLHDFSVALEKDIQMMAGNRFAVLRSHTLEQFGSFGLSKMPDLVNVLKMSKKLPSSFKLPDTFKLPTTFGADELAAGIGRHIGSGKMDVETITHYLDGWNQASWAVVGYLVGGSEGAKLYQSIAGTGAKLLRAASQPLFNKAVLFSQGQGAAIVKQWETLQERRVYDGLTVQRISDVYGKNLLLQNGLSRKHIDQLDGTADDLNRKLVSMKTDLSVDKIKETKNTERIELGGVLIAPEPKYVGIGGENVKKNVLGSRPSEDALTWSVQLPESEE